MQNQNSDIKVSVCIVSYNQEKYIGECLESLVTQKTNFPFEIIIGDDASSDNTPQIILDYQKKYPEIIQPVLRTKNLGPIANIIDIYKRAKGKYIAHLDGDDMALPGKLQIQADGLDANPDCIICSHDVLLWDKKLTKNTFRQKESGIYTLLDLYEQLPFFAHSSKMFRNDLTEKYWNNFSNTALDVTIHVNQSRKGHIFHIKKVYGIYRINIGIASSKGSLNPIIPTEVEKIYEDALNDTDFCKEKILTFYAKAFFGFAYKSALFEDKEDLVQYISQSIAIKHYSKLQVIFYYLRPYPWLIINICKIRNYINKIKKIERGLF